MTGECETKTVREAIDQMARSRGDDVFLISPETAKTLTFGELQEQSKAISTRLRQAGLSTGDKAAFLLDNGLFTIQLFLGTMYSGLVSVPLNVRAGLSQLAYTLDHCDAKAVFVEEQYLALAREALASVNRPVQLITVGAEAFATDYSQPLGDVSFAAPSPEDVSLLMYTSGSVGQPKAAIHSHRTVLAHGRNSITSHQLTAADRSLLVLPLYHINAECVTLMPALLSGGSVVVPHHFNVSQFWDWLDEYRCTWSAVVPTIISQLLDWKDPRAEQRQPVFQRVRFLRSSSAPLSPSLQREFMEKFPIRLIQAMGSSEAGNIFSNPQPPRENKIGTPGPAWGFETRIINPEGSALPPGEPGEVLIRGAAVMQGYYKDPEQTAAVFDAEGWLHTGDLAYQDHDGYFFIIGRSKELIIKAGMNIAPRQIDEVLESHPAVLEAAVVGVPDHYVGEDLVAFAVLRAGVESDERAMLAFCENRLGHFKTPTRIHFVADLPKGPSGKVQRLRLLEQVGQLATTGPEHSNGNASNNGKASNNGHAAGAAEPAADRAIEEVIAASWAQVLGQPEIGPEFNFFSLGGHSLMAIQCLSHMREKLPVMLSLSDFFENPTVAQQAALIKQRISMAGLSNGHAVLGPSSSAGQAASSQSAKVPELQLIPVHGRSWSHPLSSGQRRIWFFQEFARGVPLYNESEAVRLVGQLRPDAMERALNLIIARHEMLRTTIRSGDDGPEAVVHASWPLQMKRIDLSDWTPAQREAEVARLLIEEPRAPYHLESAPGIRVTLIRLGPAEHVFILMMHHLVCDWASEGVLWRELSSAYRAICRGEQVSAAPLAIQYGDYAIWQQQRVAEAGFAEDLNFWENNLRGAPELLELPSDRPRPAVQSYRGARQRFRLSPALTQALRDCSRREKASLFTVFTAALETLLHRYTGSEDIVVGVPISERERQELSSVIGFLIHTQVLRVRLSGGMTFRELLAAVQKGSLELYSHREVPFEQVVNRVSPERSLSHSPLFQVMINWRDRDQHPSFIGLDGLAVESLLAESRTSKFDLTLTLTDFGDEIWLEAEYSTDLFDDDRIARMFGHYQTLLEAVVADPGRSLAELPLLTHAERRQLLVEWNATEVPYPRDLCLHQLFEQQAARTPDAIAVVFGDCRISYRELNQRSNQLANHLQKLGVGPEVLVGICVERSVEMVVGLLAILKAGGAYVPLDPEYPPERLAFMLEDSGVAVLLTQEPLLEVLPKHDAQVICLDREWPTVAQNPSDQVLSTVNSENLAYVIYTSGSTGKPKGAMNTHGGVCNRLYWMQDEYHLSPSETVLQKTPFSFDVSVWEFFWPLLNGARLVLARPGGHRDSEYLTGLIREHSITTVHFVPSMLRVFLDEAEVSKCVSLKRVICSGEALPFELQERFFARMNAALHNLYGPTEASVDVTFWACRPGYANGVVPIGRPIANTTIYILDSHLHPVPVGAAGELYIGGAGLGRGYLNRPELTAERFIKNPYGRDDSERLYRTGDLARYRADGNIEYLGRTDYQIKLRGFRIELGEIEAALRQHPAVGESVVVVREDRASDKKLVAYFAAVDRRSAPGTEQLREFLKQKLPDYMIPSSFMLLDKFPLTPNGKIDRKALPAPELERTISTLSFVPPRTPMEHVLADIWSQVLGVKEIGVHDDFFALGGHSLQVTQLLGKIHKSIDRNLPVAMFFQNSTIQKMAMVIQETEKQTKSRNRLIRLNPGSFRGSLFFLDAAFGLSRLAQLLKSGPVSFATSVPLDLAGSTHRSVALPSLENLAIEHVDLIRAAHRDGPCLLAGYSWGGPLAFEVAHQLGRHGLRVDMILLLDSWTKNPRWWSKLKALSFGSELPLLSRTSHLWSRVYTAMSEGRVRFAVTSKSDDPVSDQFEKVTISVDEVPWRTFSNMLRKAIRDYNYRKLDSHGVLFRSKEDLYSRHLVDGNMGWNGLFERGLEIMETPGDHWSFLKEPHLQILAKKIDDRLERFFEYDSHKPSLEFQEMQRHASAV